ncbi:hypothetical protein SO078_29595 (plasmid) [Sinorhizobium meliloti]|uniref:hypothetical protein n=1 Tax=Rhizobium meliloti TaxID=382 RepID=UPI002D79526E|nr:hypothetical protein [Sinorhizobium meliloti]WRQ72116.1 hypothetical protein SO078_29595 [Sinorhizobium meliloti]
MSTQQATFVRASMIEASPAPSLERGAASWLRRNLFATPKDSVLTIISLLILAWLVPPRNPMALHRCRLERRWPGRLRNAVAGRFAAGRLERRMLGVRQCEIRPVPFRPLSARRSAGVLRWSAILFVLLLVPMLIPRIPYKGLNALLLLGALPVLAAILLPGGWFGLTYVETPLWGGLMVTLVLSSSE